MKNITDQTRNEMNDKISMGVKILETQEIERKRIAMDLHDTTIQNMTSVIHRIELCTKLLDIDKEKTRDELKSVKVLVHEIINEMRDIVYNLQPTSLIDIGLTAAINRLVEKSNQTNNTITILSEYGTKQKLTSIQEITIYRVIQEACNNALCYSNAKVINISIIYNKDTVTITISDDGKGFKINKNIEDSDVIIKARSEGHGYGIAIMRERVFLLKGTFSIKSEIDSGTKIEIVIPLEEED